MIKTVFKEIIIVLLLSLAILLVLSVLFYDYNPISKVVPNKIAYTVPEGIEDELEEENAIEELAIENRVYTIEGSDLNIYKKSNSYNPGKANPFSATTTDTNVVNSASSTEKTNNTNASNGEQGQTVTDKSTNVESSTNNNVSDTTNTTFWNSTGSK